MTTEGYTLTKQTVERLAVVTRMTLGRLPRSGVNRSRRQPTEDVHFYLGEALAAAANPRTGWTTARAYVYYESEEGDLVYNDEQVIIRNRYTGMTGAAGQYGLARPSGDYLDAYTLDCDVDGSWSVPEALNIDAEPGPGD